MKELRIRGIRENQYKQLEHISNRYRYPNVNQFMLSQLQEIITNDGLNQLHNHFADELYEIRKIQQEVHQSLLIRDTQIFLLKNQIQELKQTIQQWHHFLLVTMSE